MVEIRRLQPLVQLRLPQRPQAAGPYVRQKLKVVVRRRRDFPPPTPQATPCVLWQGSVDRQGYGRRKVDRRGMRVTIGVHRWVMEQVLGRTLESGEFILHACDNPPCYRVEHLSVGSVYDNNRDMLVKGRATKPPVNVFRGELHPMAKLSEAQVRRIHKMREAGFTVRTIAEEFAVSRSQVQRIVSGKRWQSPPTRDLVAEAKARIDGFREAPAGASSVRRLSIPKK
jgi:hypothetical protein